MEFTSGSVPVYKGVRSGAGFTIGAGSTIAFSTILKTCIAADLALRIDTCILFTFCSLAWVRRNTMLTEVAINTGAVGVALVDLVEMLASGARRAVVWSWAVAAVAG